MILLLALSLWQAMSDARPLLSLTVGVTIMLALSGSTIAVLDATKLLQPPLQRELWRRWKSWLGVAVAMLVPVLLGGVWLAGAVLLLSMLCYLEYAGVTGIAGERLLTMLVGMGSAALTLASWYGVERFPLVLGMILLMVGAPVVGDRPEGYLRRVGLAVLGFLLFGVSEGV